MKSVEKPSPRAVVRGLTDPARAWEALAVAGHIPASFIDDDRRRFSPNDDPSAAGFLLDEHDLLAHPPTVSMAVGIANELAEFVTAEELAHECATALAGNVRWWRERIGEKRWWTLVAASFASDGPAQWELLTDPPRRIVWDAFGSRRKERHSQVFWPGWSVNLSTLASFTGLDVSALSTEEVAKDAWNDPRNIPFPPEIPLGTYQTLIQFTMRQALQEEYRNDQCRYPLSDLANPYAPLRRMEAETGHGNPVFVPVDRDGMREWAVRIGYGLW